MGGLFALYAAFVSEKWRAKRNEGVTGEVFTQQSLTIAFLDWLCTLWTRGSNGKIKPPVPIPGHNGTQWQGEGGRGGGYNNGPQIGIGGGLGAGSWGVGVNVGAGATANATTPWIALNNMTGRT